MTETNRIEYKERLTKDLDLEKEVIAFLNYNEGGFIYLGIDKHGTVVGVNDMDGDMLKIKDRLKNNIQPSCMGLFDVSSDEKEGLDIIKVTVASGSEKPYYKRKFGMSEKGCYIRLGTAAEPMPLKMIDELFAKRTRDSIGKIKSSHQNLSFEQLKIYYEAKNITLNKQFTNNLELVTERGELNYVAYLMSDENGISIKVAKYAGLSRVDLIENEDYGYCSIIKATKSVLDKLELENTTITKITSKERNNQRLWDAIALKEAVLNAFVHNDYTSEVPPKFEIFEDRIEITSTGGLPNSLSKDEFFEGYSVPRNKELMRIYKDLDLVEQLGSGVPRILEHYGKDCFKLSDNFLRMTFPKAENKSNQVGNQVGNQESNQDKFQISNEVLQKMLYSISHLLEGEEYQPTEKSILKYKSEAELLTETESKILEYCQQPKKRKQILEDCLGISNQTKNFKTNVSPLIEKELIQLTIKDTPQSKYQKYFITTKGKVVLFLNKENNY